MKKRDIMTTGEFAKATETPYQTVARWARDGLIPGAHRQDTLRGPVWVIPKSALDSFDEWKPKLGRPPNPGTKKVAKVKKRRP